MICIIALIVLAILSIFSAKYRSGAKEAFNCVFRRVTLRKCDTGFDRKMKLKITGKLMNKYPSLSRVVYRHFEAISWIFTIILFVSLAFSVMGVYNLMVYGTCDPENPQNCPIGETMYSPYTGEEICECGFNTDECKVEDFKACGVDCNCLEERCT